MIFLDTETTGLLQPEANDLNLQPYITELYMIQVEWDSNGFSFIKEFESMFHVPVPLSDKIIKITGITDAMLMDKPTFALKYEEIAKFFLGEDTFVGHNLSFDAGMLWVELARIQCDTKFPWPIHHKCTVELSLGVKNHRLKLGDLHEIATGKPHTGAHRAKEDTFAMIRCYEWLIREGYIVDSHCS
jgi:DNA polymerase III epsilon subunit-like protein